MIVDFQALDKSGELIADTLSVEEQHDAYTELTRRGLTPVRIEARGGGTANVASLQAWWRSLTGATDAASSRKASKRHLPFFTAQMAILLETGTPLANSLASMEQQMTCPHWAQLVGRLRQSVEEGCPLAASMAQYPHVFEQVYSNMIAAGEKSGSLEEIFRRLAHLSRQADRLRSKIMAAMIYPILLTTVALSVLAVLVFYVLPRFEGVFADMKVDLPGSTKALLFVSHTVRSNLVPSLMLLGGVVAGIVWFLRSRQGKRLIDLYSVKMPIMGPLVQSINLGRIFRLLELLIQSRLPLLEALELTGEATRNYLYAEMLEKVKSNVVDGLPMWQTLQRSWLVTPGLAQMVRTGEESGRVSDVMKLLADHLDDENETKVGMLTSIMEPLILIFMGIIVGTVALSLVLPLFDLSQVSA